jgi:cold shock CspA family protein/ribosome-associated translation inhibitor RaiA
MQVPLQIVFKNLDRSKAVVARIKEHVAWLEEFYRGIISCRVLVEEPHKHHRTGNLFHVRISLRVPDEELVVSRDRTLHMAHKDAYVAIRDAFDDARRLLEDYIRRRRVEVKTDQRPPHAFVARLVREDGGYGFIHTEDGREIYFHSRSVLNDGYDRLEVGAEVRFTEEMGEEGPQASTVEIVGREGRKTFPTNLRKVS